MKPLNTLLVVSLTTSLLYGCAAAVVGGAATGATAAHDRRTVGTFIDDEGIELKARLAVLRRRPRRNASKRRHSPRLCPRYAWCTTK
jgi:osmotically-inducible protein OsmY